MKAGTNNSTMSADADLFDARLTPLEMAIVKTLRANRQRFALDAGTIAALLPQFGFNVTRGAVSRRLRWLARDEQPFVRVAAGGWKTAKKGAQPNRPAKIACHPSACCDDDATVAQITLDLCDVEVRALHWWREKWFSQHGGNIASVAQAALWAMLTQPVAFENFLKSVARYKKAEGIREGDFMRESLRRRFNYSKTKIPAS